MSQFNFKFNLRSVADSFRSCREKLSRLKREDVVDFFRALPRKIRELKPREVYDFIVTALAVIHVRLAAVFLWVFRTIGKGLARIPWALRYAIALFAAALILLLIYSQGSSLFLLNSYSAMEPYADRNANKIGFSAGDIGTFMTFQLFDLTKEQKEKAEKLDAIFQKNRSGEGAVPTEEQIQLVHELSGVSMEYLEGAMNISVQLAPVKLAVHLKLEKADGTAGNVDKEIENPTPSWSSPENLRWATDSWRGRFPIFLISSRLRKRMETASRRKRKNGVSTTPNTPTNPVRLMRRKSPNSPANCRNPMCASSFIFSRSKSRRRKTSN